MNIFLYVAAAVNIVLLISLLVLRFCFQRVSTILITSTYKINTQGTLCRQYSFTRVKNFCSVVEAILDLCTKEIK